MNTKILLLDDQDNIVICIQPIQAGDTLMIDNETITVRENISIGHKIARFNLDKNEKILRYGAPIGSATEIISKGAHVHLHNMRSDYIPSHTRSQQAVHRG